MRKFVLAALIAMAGAFCGLPCPAQAPDNTIYVKQFQGPDVGAKLKAAIGACNPDVRIPCVLVLDPSLATWATGTIPTLCPQCSLVDYRNGTPAASVAGQTDGLVPTALQQTSYPGQFAGVAQLVNNPANPVIPYGSGGAFDAGETRDAQLVRTYRTQAHEYYMLYTAAKLTVSPWNPTIGIAYSDDGLTWFKAGQVIAATGTCGGVFSPGAFYDYDPATRTGTRALYVYASCITNAAQWYTGPIKIYTLTVGAGKDWTVPANYVWGGSPSLVKDQGWEGNQGVYAPDVKKVNGVYTMWYSSADGLGAGPWDIGIATASSPLGPWSKWASNPVTASHNAEEPNILQMANGNLLMFSDTMAVSLGRGFSIYTTNSADGKQTPYVWQQFIAENDAGTWDGNHVGSQSVVTMPNGDILVAFGAQSGGTDQIGTAIIRLRSDVTSAYGQSSALQTSYQELLVDAAGGYPNRVRYTGKGYTFFGDANAAASGQVILGDIGTLTSNVGIRRSSDGNTNAAGNWIALDGVSGAEINTGSGTFGNKWNALSILATGQLTHRFNGASTTYGIANFFCPNLATSGTCGLMYGVDSGVKNSALLEFNYLGAANAGNKASLGINGSAYSVAIDNAGNVTGMNVIQSPQLAVGGGTTLSKMAIYSPTVTTTSVPANSCADTSVTGVTGIVATDNISNYTPPSSMGNLSLNIWPTGAGSLSFHFCNSAASSGTPPSGVYRIFAVR